MRILITAATEALGTGNGRLTTPVAAFAGVETTELLVGATDVCVSVYVCLLYMLGASIECVCVSLYVCVVYATMCVLYTNVCVCSCIHYQPDHSPPAHHPAPSSPSSHHTQSKFGGSSTAAAIVENDALTFKGELAPYDGVSFGMALLPCPANLASTDGLQLRVRGDGQTYKLLVKTV